jgi:hypothetical protein
LSIFELPSDLVWFGEICLFFTSLYSLFDSSAIKVKIGLALFEMTSRGLNFDFVLSSLSGLLIVLVELILIFELRFPLTFCLPLEVKKKN